MKEHRAKTLIRTLATLKLDTLVGVQTYPLADDEWNVTLAPGQIVGIVDLGMRLHFHGFTCHHGAIQGAPPQANGMPGEGFVFNDVLPEMLPVAEEVEHISPDDLRREQTYGPDGRPSGWVRVYDGPRGGLDNFSFSDAARRAQEEQNTQARTGGEGRWRPGP